MSTVRADKHGRLFVVLNCGVYRPQAGPWEFPCRNRNFGRGIQTAFEEGAQVVVRHLRSRGGLCRVISMADPAHEEMWACHGYKPNHPEECWHGAKAAAELGVS